MQRISMTVGIMALAAASAVAPSQAADVEANKALIGHMVEAINGRDFEALEKIVAPGIRRHCAATPGVNVTSLREFIEFLHQDLSAVPDARVEIDFMLAEGDLVAGRFIYRGTQKGPWGPFPPSNKTVELPFLGIHRIAGGRIAEIWVEWDNLNALQQLGHLRPPEEPDQPGGSR